MMRQGSKAAALADPWRAAGDSHRELLPTLTRATGIERCWRLTRVRIVQVRYRRCRLAAASGHYILPIAISAADDLADTMAAALGGMIGACDEK
jgi:hypothetical protein